MKASRYIMMALGCGLLLAATPISAHHNASVKYDSAKPVTFTGKVTKVEWMNPHIHVYVDAPDASGKMVNWTVEGATPNQLYRRGWKRTSLKIGDTVTIEGVKARQVGLNHANARSVVLADGTKERACYFASSFAASEVERNSLHFVLGH